MKNNLIFLVLVLFSINVSGNNFADWIDAEVTFYDGHSERGFVSNFTTGSFYDFSSPFVIPSIEKRTNLDDKSFKFKRSTSDTVQKLTQDQVKAVKLLYNDGSYVDYHVLTLQSIGKNNEIITSNTKAWLPLFRPGKVNLFSYDVYSKMPGGPQYQYTLCYLNNGKNNFALGPMLILPKFLESDKRISLLVALSEVFKDCPEYVTYLEKNFNSEVDKKFKDAKEQKDDFKLKKSQIKGMSRKERRSTLINAISHYATDPFLEFIVDYEKTCPN